jgi:uncharacterized protein (DUF169 family)
LALLDPDPDPVALKLAKEEKPIPQLYKTVFKSLMFWYYQAESRS